MANTIRIKRSTGSAAPGSLANAELAYAEGSGKLYVGVGTGGAGGSATTVQQIASTDFFTSQSAGVVFASPSASAGSPTFRALASTDLPSHTHSIANVTSLQTTLDAKAPLASPTFTGVPAAPTPVSTDNSTTIATTAYVKSQGYSTTTGTVTSVSMTVPSILSVAGSPVTTSGTLAVTLATQAANVVFAGPSSGGSLAPTFRSLVAADLPSHTHSIANVTGLQTALDAKAALSGATFTGAISGTTASFTGVTSPTIALGSSSTTSSTNVLATTFDDGGTPGTGAYLTAAGDLTVNGLTVLGAVAVGGLTTTGDITIDGNLTVSGTTVTMNTETVNVEDKNIVLGNVPTPTTTTGDGGGVTVRTAATAAGDKTLTWVNATDSWTSNVDFNLASGKVYKINGTQISASSLSNGVTGSGKVVLESNPTLLGVPAAPTAAADTNTTQLATTAFVAGQASATTPAMNAATAVIGTSLKYARADHVHPTDTSRAATSGSLAQFAATTSSQLAGVISDETGSGNLVFGTSPTLTAPLYSSETGIVAAGSTQATATLLTKDINYVSGPPTGNGVRLPTASAGRRVIVRNTTGAALNVYPHETAGNQAIDSNSVNSPFTLTNNSAVEFACISSGGQPGLWTSLVPTAALSGLGSGVATFLATPSSSNLRAAVTDEAGAGGALVFADSPTFTGTPAAPTAAADTNTTQLATTAYVVGQGYLKSATAASSYQPLDAELTAIAGLTSAADRLPYYTGSQTAALAVFTTFGRSLVDDADNSAARTTLGLGTMATQASSNVSISGGSIDGITIDGGSW